MHIEIFKLASLFYKLSTDIIDARHRFEQKQQEQEAQKVKDKFLEVVPNEPVVPQQTDIERARTRKQMSEIKKETGVWMHRFSDVRKDNLGFFIYKGDNESGNNMSPGDLLADHALNMTPYWRISNITGNRINLIPIGPNPFLTGIGAGGAKLTDYDISVFTGESEKKRVENIQKSLEDGNATIDDIIYLLDGTVPVNMGPNGAQGGWYNVQDTHSNRGGKKGMKEKEIMISDAKRLQSWGFSVPKLALSGEMNPYDWGQWISGNGTQDVDYIPKDMESYINYHKKMTEKGRWRYDEKSLAEKRRQLSVEESEKYWEQVTEDFISNPQEYKTKYPHYPKTLKELIEFSGRRINEVKQRIQKQDIYLTEAEDQSEESILKNIFNKERRVSIRNIIKLIEMTRENPAYIKYLYDFIKMGGSDWLANENVINFFNEQDDIEGLKLALQHLTEEDNRKYAFSYLAKLDPAAAINLVSENETFGGLKGLFESILSANREPYGKPDPDEDKEATKEKERKAFELIVSTAEKFKVLDKIETALNSGNVMEKHHAGDLLGILLSSISGLTFARFLDEKNVKKFYPEQYDFIMKLRELNKLIK